jgi:hypothetical protein
VSDTELSNHPMQDIAFEHLGHEAHAFVSVELFPVRGNYAGAFLSAMLQRIKAVVR